MKKKNDDNLGIEVAFCVLPRILSLKKRIVPLLKSRLVLCGAGAELDHMLVGIFATFCSPHGTCRKYEMSDRNMDWESLSLVALVSYPHLHLTPLSCSKATPFFSSPQK